MQARLLATLQTAAALAQVTHATDDRTQNPVEPTLIFRLSDTKNTTSFSLNHTPFRI
jgi:hypothetical protein